MGQYFIDTTFLISLILENDENHEKAVKIAHRRILEKECYLSNFVLGEVISILGNHLDENISQKAYQMIIDNFIILNEYDVPEFKNTAMDLYVKFKTKLSYNDCITIAIMDYHGIPDILERFGLDAGQSLIDAYLASFEGFKSASCVIDHFL